MDRAAAQTLDHFTAHHAVVRDVFTRLEAGSELLFAAVLLALWLLVPTGQRIAGRRAALTGVAGFAVGALLVQVISRLVDRPRPFVAHPAAIHALIAHARDAGFPSDHATAAFAIAIGVGLRHRSWGLALAVVAALVAVGRVCLGLHYPTDVLAGAALGALSAVAVSAFAGRRLDAVADRLGALTDRALHRGRPPVASGS